MEKPGTPTFASFQRPRGVVIVVILAAFRGLIGLWASIAVVGVLTSFGADDFSLLGLIWLAIAVDSYSLPSARGTSSLGPGPSGSG